MFRFTLPLTLSLTVLAACGGLKTVPVDALAKVPSAKVPELAEVQASVDEQEDELEDIIERHEEVARNLKDTERAASSALADLEDAKNSRARAVSEGDYDTAESLAGDLAAAESTYQRRQKRLEEQTALFDLTKQAIELRTARMEAKVATLESARADAAALGGAQIKTEKYERQETKLQSRAAEEASELEAMESDLGVQL